MKQQWSLLASIDRCARAETTRADDGAPTHVKFHCSTETRVLLVARSRTETTGFGLELFWTKRPAISRTKSSILRVQ